MNSRLVCHPKLRVAPTLLGLFETLRFVSPPAPQHPNTHILLSVLLRKNGSNIYTLTYFKVFKTENR